MDRVRCSSHAHALDMHVLSLSLSLSLLYSSLSSLICLTFAIVDGSCPYRHFAEFLRQLLVLQWMWYPQRFVE